MDNLKRELSELDVWSLALGAIIGWGCFVLPGNKFLNDAGPLGTAIALSIGALIMIFIARSYGVLIPRFPVAGGEFAYAYVGFKRKHAFFAAWMLGLSYLSIVPLDVNASVLQLHDQLRDNLKKIAPYAFLGSLSSIGFIVLLLTLGSSTVLSLPSLMTLLVWGLMGLGFSLSSKDDRKATDTLRTLSFGFEVVHGDA